MFKENGEFHTELEFVHKYNIKTNFLQFNGLKAAIKVFAKKLKLDTIRNKLSNPMLPTNISVFLRSTKGSKNLYNIQIKTTTPRLQRKNGKKSMILRKKLGKIFIVLLLNRFVALNYNGFKLVLYIDYFQPKNTYIISKQWTLQTVTFATRKKQYHICYGPALKPFR